MGEGHVSRHDIHILQLHSSYASTVQCSSSEVVIREQLVPNGEDADMCCGIDGTVVDDGGNNDNSSSIYYLYSYCATITPTTTHHVYRFVLVLDMYLDTSINHPGCI